MKPSEHAEVWRNATQRYEKAGIAKAHRLTVAAAETMAAITFAMECVADAYDKKAGET